MYIVIVGCSRVGAELAKLLSLEGNDVVVVDKNEGAFSHLGEAFNGLIVKGNGVSIRTLQEAGIKKTDIFCSLTNSDNINIMASQVAKVIFNVPRVISRIYDPSKAVIYKKLGLDILSETTLFSSMIRDKIIDKMLSSYLIETNRLGVLEIPLPAKFIGKTVEEINIPGKFIISAIRRFEQPPSIPTPKTLLEKGDILVAVVEMKSLHKTKKVFQL